MIVLGVVFILVGILGFVNNPVLGIFSVNALHNVIHLVSGILALVFAFKSAEAARKFALVFGLVYALVAVLGFVAPDFMSNLLMTNTADHWLHVVLAVVLIWVGTMKSNSMMNS
jgi:hypothetical protein